MTSPPFFQTSDAAIDAGAAYGLNPDRVADVAQLVERQVVVLDVVGSSPIVRPKEIFRTCLCAPSD